MLFRPLDLSEDALAGKAIDDVSRVRDGLDNYPSHDHTFEHFRNALWLPPHYWERGQEHERSLPERLTDSVKDILATHNPTPLDDNKLAEIDEYLQSM